MTTIRYSVIGGQLPQGCRVVSSKGTMKIEGVIPLHTVENSPSFTSTSQLGLFDELVNMSITLGVQAKGAKTITGLSIVNGYLPWGLTLVNRTISGIPAELAVKEVSNFVAEDAPTWVTNDGLLLDGQQLTTVQLALTATPKTGRTIAYDVVSGCLPFGLVLSHDGTITGALAEDLSGAVVEPPKSPIWETPKGEIAVADEFSPVSVFVSALSRTDSTMGYYIVGEGLPWGLVLNAVTGEIAGSTAEIPYLELVNENPLQNVKPTLPTAGLSSKIGVPYSVTLQTGIPTGRTLLSMDVTSGYLPLGMNLVNNTISGTPIYTGSTSFSITLTDSEYSSITTPFTFEVTA